jgi:superfamily II DNA or RNA helicase
VKLEDSSVASSLAEGAVEIERRERSLLRALALAGPQNITGLTRLASLVNVRESAARAYSTQRLREVLARFVKAGWVTEDGDRFQCSGHIGPRLLRLSASSGELPILVQAIKSARLRERAIYSNTWSPRGVEAELDLLSCLAAADDTMSVYLDELLSSSLEPEVTRSLLLGPVIGSFEAAWFERFNQANQKRLTDLVLRNAEVNGWPLLDFGAYLQQSARGLGADASECLGRILLLKGESHAGVGAPVGTSVAFMSAVASGEYERARALLVPTGKKQALLAGSAGVFQCLLLLRNLRLGDLDEAARLSKLGARKGVPFRDSFHALRGLTALALEPGAQLFDVLAPHGDGPGDCLLPLISAYAVIWHEAPAGEERWIAQAAAPWLSLLERSGWAWLTAQYQAALALLATANQREPERAHPAVAAPPGFVPLHQIWLRKEPWQAALERFERLAGAGNGASVASSAPEERVIWKTCAPGFLIEPYLQKRQASGWSKGRRLAIKHLLPGGANRKSLAAEDEAVASFAREEHFQRMGYPETHHFIDPGGWTALVGHPRVFLEDSDTPIHVTRGTLQLVAQASGDGFSLTVEPEGWDDAGPVRLENGRLVVYPRDEALHKVLSAVGSGLRVPSSERARLLAAAAQLAHVIPLHSNEPTLARAVPGDATPWLRLVPRSSGLSVSLRVRPLGERGPAVLPGAGSTLLLAQVGGETLQASRDLALEARLAEELSEACAALAGRETADYEWLIAEAEFCLELVSALDGLGERVHVEWPHGKSLRLRGRLDRTRLRGAVQREGASFLLDAALSVDDDLSLRLPELLALMVDQPGRFVRLESGDYLELSRDLRDQLAAIQAARAPRAGESARITLPASALGALDTLLADGTGLTLEPAVIQWRDDFARVFDSKPRLPRGLRAELRDYQLDGFRWLARLGELGLGACLADDMGLGKTVQLIALLLHRSRTGPALVVAPTSVCENWRREIERFAPTLRIRWFSGPNRAPELHKLGAQDVVVTGYATLQQDATELQAIAWGTVVLDEAQFIKNMSARRTQTALGLKAGMRVTATGTPVENHAGDLASLFHFLLPDLLGDPATFQRRFALEGQTEASRESRRALRRLIAPFILRRTKAQVATELPPITEIEHKVTLSTEETLLYEAVRKAALQKLSVKPKPGESMVVLSEITRLRRLCCHPRLAVPESTASSSKLASLVALVDELREGGHRALVFSQFVDVLQLASEALRERGVTFQYLDGSLSQKQRTTAVDAFQAGEGDVFLISLKAGGFGLNLTAADYVIHLDPWWNPATESQATDRAHRIGQQNPVTLYRLVAAGTIEERILALHRSKRELADSILAESDRAAAMSSAELRALLEA